MNLARITAEFTDSKVVLFPTNIEKKALQRLLKSTIQDDECEKSAQINKSNPYWNH